MIQTVVKRDGRIVGFNEQKIMAAIRKAMLHTDKGEDSSLIEQITDHVAYRGKSQMSVEAIQDAVELELMKSARKDVAQRYIAYRNQRSIARKAKTRDIFMSIVNAKNNDITRENANMNADTPAGMMMKFASETTKPFVDDYLLSEESRDAVKHNYLHIHDKDYYPTKSLTCVQHPLDVILQHGFTAGHGSSRPAKRIETAAVLACISLETCQNEMHGGQAIPAFDFYLAPYVRMSYQEEVKNLEKLTGKDLKHLYNIEIDDYLQKDLEGLEGDARLEQHAINKTVNRVHQAMEAFIHNMNTIHSRGGNQVVFSSINYGTDTSAEGRCIMREILESTYEGVGNGETAIFPIQIWKKKRGVNYLPEDRNYDLYQLACKVTARRFFPNFLNLDATFNQNEKWHADDPERYKWEIATMGCRTRVFEDRWGEKTSIARGNLSFSTINIVKLAIECMGIEDKKQRIDMFFAKLDNILQNGFTSFPAEIELIGKSRIAIHVNLFFIGNSLFNTLIGAGVPYSNIIKIVQQLFKLFLSLIIQCIEITSGRCCIRHFYTAQLSWQPVWIWKSPASGQTPYLITSRNDNIIFSFYHCREFFNRI